MLYSVFIEWLQKHHGHFDIEGVAVDFLYRRKFVAEPYFFNVEIGTQVFEFASERYGLFVFS